MNPKEPIFLSRSFVVTEGSVPSLRGKVLSDTTPEISSLRDSLLRDWMPHGEVTFSPLSDGTFLVRFDMVQDVVKVWNSGPWFYNDDLLLLQPDIHTVHQLEFTKARFWVEFHGLPGEYLSTSAACALATRIGEPMEFSSPSYIPGQVGSMTVQILIDVTKPLTPSLRVVLEDGSHVEVSVNYGRLPRLCQLCGVLGHELERCGHTRNGQTEKMNVRNDLMSNVSNGSTPLPSASGGILSHTSERPLVTANLHKLDSSEASALTVLEEKQPTDVIPANNCLPLKSILNKFLSACLQGPSHFQLGGDVQPCSDSGVTVRVELLIKIPVIETRHVPRTMKLISKQTGVMSVTIAGGDHCLFLVIGYLDPVITLTYLRRRIGGSQLVELREVRTEMLSNIESSSPARFEGPSHFQLGGDVQPCSYSGVTVRVEFVIKIPIRRHVPRAFTLLSKQKGVESVTIGGEERSLVLVIGSNLDPVIMLRYLMRQIGVSQLLELRQVPTLEMSSNIESSSPARFEVSALQLLDEICAHP